MSRRHRVDVEGAVHHVMNRGVDRQAVFFADADRVEFGRRLDAIHGEFGVETLAYCLMDNHYHLLLRTPQAGLSDAMQQLGSLYTRHTNDRVGRDGPLFRGRFHSILVTTDAYLVWVARYIHRNPLALDDVASADRYRWSSYRTYLGHRRAPEFINTQPLLAMFDGDRARLASFTNDAGGDRFPTTDDLADLRQLVDFAIADDDMHAEAGGDEDPRVLQRSLLLLMVDQGGLPAPLRDQAVALLDFPTPAARRMAMHRARRRLAGDATLQRVLHRLRRCLGHPISTTAA